jgi:hypothetical protein
MTVTIDEPLGNLDATRGNDLDSPYESSVWLLDDGSEPVAMLRPDVARRLAYRILAAVEDGAIEQSAKLCHDKFVTAGILPPDRPKLTAVRPLAPDLKADRT